MSSELSQAIQLLRNIGLGQNQQILSVNGNANQLTHQRTLSSSGPNGSQRTHIANSNINNVTVNFHFIGNSILGAAKAIANEDHGAYPNHRPAVTSYARPSMIEAADDGDLNAKLAAVKESTADIRKSTEGMKESIDKLAETTDKVSEWITKLGWSTFKYRLDKEAEVAFGDSVVELCMSLVRLSQSILEFGRSSVEHGESTARDSYLTLMTEDGESISQYVFDTLISELGEVAAAFRESCARFKESFMRHAESFSHFDTDFDESELDDSEDSQLKEFMEAADFEAFGEITSELIELITSPDTPLEAFTESMVAYAKSLGAPGDVISAFILEDD